MALAQRATARISPSRQYAPYIEAVWGLKNHWYPALFSNELGENEVKGVLIAGHEIALRRAKGKAYAMQNRCPHRGVKLSAKPLILTDDLMTCWYHGFSFGLGDGVLKTIAGCPDDPNIGRVRIRTYPVEEVAGIIFVFVGDQDYKPVPPLSSDLPLRITDDPNPIKHLLDPDVFVRGIHRTGRANWRLAVENGYDPGHLLIHWDSMMVNSQDRLMPIGVEPVREDAVRFIDEPDGPKGIMCMYNVEGAWKPIIENPIVKMRAKGKKPYYFRVSTVLPGLLQVEHWPIPGWSQLEWYIPTDDKHHEYWEVVVGPCRNEEERKEAESLYTGFFEPIGLRGFNDADLFAREAMQKFYEDNAGWDEEVLCMFDNALVAWRKAVSRFNRGIQEPPRLCEQP